MGASMWWILLVLGCAAPARTPEPVVEAPVSTPCLAAWRRDSGRSVLVEQRRAAGARWSDFATGYPAEAIGPTHVPVAHTARFRVADRPVLWFTADRSAAVVDPAAFGDLAVVDATSLSDGEAHPLGSATAATRATLGDRQTIEFLVEADAIRIYAHVHGEVCLTHESSSDGRYVARFEGTHVYFTNEENEAPLRFEVQIDAAGRITVRGVR